MARKLRIGAVLSGVASFFLACTLAAIFSGSPLAPLTAMPVAALGGLLAGWLDYLAFTRYPDEAYAERWVRRRSTR